MHLRKIFKALLFAALIFVFVVVSAACGVGESQVGDIDASDNITRPNEGDDQKPDIDEPDPPEDPLDPEPTEPDPPTEPDFPNPGLPETPDDEDPDVPDEPTEPETPVYPDTSDPEPDNPDPKPDPPVDPPEPEDPDPPVEPDITDPSIEPDPEGPDPDIPIDPEPTDPDIPPIDPEPVEPDEPDPPPIKFKYEFVYGLDYKEKVSGTAEQGVSVNALAADVGVPYYVFTGWQVNGETADFPYIVEADTTFRAAYDPIKYKVAYELNGGVQNIRNPIDYTCENSDLPLFAPTRNCYTFGGWFSDSALTERVEVIASEKPHDMTLFARWQTPEHRFGEDHVCVVCGETTAPEHIYNAAHRCTVCNDAHARSEHLYDEAHTCKICGIPAANIGHTYDTDHICTVCGCAHSSEDHTYGADYLCEICGAAHDESEHVFNAEHICKICGRPHADANHTYGDDYLCLVCGAAHTSHTYDSEHSCVVCGKPHPRTEHEYDENYLCVICGHEYAGTRPWRGDTAAAFADGDGTQAAPFLISDGAELALLGKLVGDGAADIGGLFSEKYYAITADIDLGGREWTPIGKGFYESAASNDLGHAFKGVFDGNGKTIGNFVITAPSDRLTVPNNKNIYYAVGLFGALDGGTVRDLKVVDFTVSITDATATSAYNAGGIAGVAAEKSLIADCYVRGSISVNAGGTVNVGLAAGDCEAEKTANAVTIVNARVEGAVSGQGGKQTTAGGLIGLNGFGAAGNCYADVTITSESDTAAYGAGLIGNYKSSTHIDDCCALGDVSVSCKAANKAYADGFLYKSTTLSDKWIMDCLRLNTQMVTANGKPCVSKTTKVKTATAAEIADASKNAESAR